jgi:hypothetical protein
MANSNGDVSDFSLRWNDEGLKRINGGRKAEGNHSSYERS